LDDKSKKDPPVRQRPEYGNYIGELTLADPLKITNISFFRVSGIQAKPLNLPKPAKLYNP